MIILWIQDLKVQGHLQFKISLTFPRFEMLKITLNLSFDNPAR